MQAEKKCGDLAWKLIETRRKKLIAEKKVQDEYIEGLERDLYVPFVPTQRDRHTQAEQLADGRQTVLARMGPTLVCRVPCGMQNHSCATKTI